jgi:hypothetical protein
MMKELSLVVLMHGIPEHSLVAGDVGTVVHVYTEGKAYEVEFITGQGKTIAVITLAADEVRPVEAEILHVRSIAA